MNNYDRLTEKQIESTPIYNGQILHVYEDKIKLPNGTESTREYIKHIGAVAIVAVTDDNKILIERQYRYPMFHVVTELPAGKLDSIDEDKLLAAKRELREETGITADNWTYIDEYHPASAYSNERIWMYMATGLHHGKQELDEDEFLYVEEVPIETLIDQVMDGTITDGKTQVGILKVATMLGILKR